MLLLDWIPDVYDLIFGFSGAATRSDGVQESLLSVCNVEEVIPSVLKEDTPRSSTGVYREAQS